MAKLLLFDVDGVIMDSFQEVYQDTADFIKTHRGPEIDENQFREFFEGNALEHVLELVNGETNFKENGKEFFKSYQKTRVFDGMTEVLEELAQNNTLVIVTSTIIEVVIAKFEEAGIDTLFASFMGPGVAIHKDDKIKMAMEEFNFSPDQTIFISDTSGDISEAKKVKVKTVAVTWGYHDRPTLEKVKPDMIIDTPKKLLNALSA